MMEFRRKFLIELWFKKVTCIQSYITWGIDGIIIRYRAYRRGFLQLTLHVSIIGRIHYLWDGGWRSVPQILIILANHLFCTKDFRSDVDLTSGWTSRAPKPAWRHRFLPATSTFLVDVAGVMCFWGHLELI